MKIFTKKTLLLSSYIVSFLIFTTGCSHKKENAIVGPWTIKLEESNSTVVMNFSKDSTFELIFKRGDYFKGFYSINKNTITFVDNFCGTKLPGKYYYEIDKDSMKLTMLNDPFCGRKEFFPTEWIKRDNAILDEFNTDANFRPDTAQIK